MTEIDIKNSEKNQKLKQCATDRGTLSIMAIDHRNNLRQSLNPQNPSQVADQELTAFKVDVVKSLASSSSAVLIDPEYGARQVLDAGVLPESTGLIVAVEKTGYAGDPANRISETLPDWSPQKINQLGASGVKLLVYFHPDSPTADQTEHLVRQVAASCRETGIPLFLEPLSYPLDPGQGKLGSVERRRVVIETARRLTQIPGVDILKAEYPLNISEGPLESEQISACQELTDASAVPWVLLSAGVSFDTFLDQLKLACQAGASGAAVGRAVWKEAIDLDSSDRERFLYEVASKRMARVTAICNEYARPWAGA